MRTKFGRKESPLHPSHPPQLHREDKKMLAELKHSCAEKASAWEGRQKARSTELLALQESIGSHQVPPNRIESTGFGDFDVNRVIRSNRVAGRFVFGFACMAHEFGFVS